MIRRAIVVAWMSMAACIGSAHGETTAKRLDGSRVEWRKLLATGRGTLVVFATQWCKACRKELPAVTAWARKHAKVSSTLYVYSGSTPADIQRIVKRNRLNQHWLRVVVDERGEVARRYKVSRTPTLLYFDAQKRWVGRYRYLRQLPAAASRAVKSAAGPSAAIERRVAIKDSGRELGTSYDVVVFVPPAERQRAEQDLRMARTKLHQLENRLSEWRQDSEVSRINREAAAHPVGLSPLLTGLLRGALHVSQATDGAFDVTWRPLQQVWRRSAARQTVPTDRELRKVLEVVGYRQLVLRDNRLRFGRSGMKLGIAGVAKGWIVDALFKLLWRRGQRHIVVNIGGDLRTSGYSRNGGKHVFHMLDPYSPNRFIGQLRVADTAIATSGNYLRYSEVAGKRIGHILDPRTGRPPAFDGAVTVLTRDAAMADALATALYVMGPERGIPYVKRYEGVDVLYASRQGLTGTIGGAPLSASVGQASPKPSRFTTLSGQIRRAEGSARRRRRQTGR